MKIPDRYQIFPELVVILDVDEERLAPYLSSWLHLHMLLASGVNEFDLQQLIVLELCDRRRRYILDRLLMRLGRVQRRALERKIKRLLK